LRFWGEIRPNLCGFSSKTAKKSKPDGLSVIWRNYRLFPYFGNAPRSFGLSKALAEIQMTACDSVPARHVSAGATPAELHPKIVPNLLQ
jgi:hypothetical protein